MTTVSIPHAFSHCAVRMQVDRETSECSRWLAISPFGHRDIMFSSANVNSSACRFSAASLPPTLPWFCCFVFAGSLIAQRDATKSLIAITGTMVKNGHSSFQVTANSVLTVS
jgi:hypothetical protein